MTPDRYPRLLLAGLAVAVVLGLVVGSATSATAFGAYNARWDGASTLRAQADATGVEHRIVRNTTAYRTVTADDAVAIVLSPDRAYAPRDRQHIRRFVRRGGTLVVAEDYGDGGDELLRAVGATARFDGRPLRDERYHYRSPAMPRARNVTDADGGPTAGVTALTLNHGTALDPGNATVLAWSSGYAYLDADGSEDVSGDESLGARPVVAVESVGQGTVVAVADPSLFINAMLDRADNRRFARNLLSAGDRVLLDYSHTAGVPPLTAALLTVRETPWLQALVGGLLLAAVAAWRRGVGRGRTASSGDSIRTTPEDLAAYLRRIHPEWDDDRVRRIADALARDRNEDRSS